MHDIDKFLGLAWPDVAADASEKEKKTAAKYNAAGLRKLVDEYCEAENIIHAAQLGLPQIAQLCLAFYSGKRHRTFREKYAGVMLTKFSEQLQAQFELVCSQQLHRYGCNITAEQGLPLKLNAQWVKSPKCGWIWMRKMGKSQNCRNERTLSGRVLLRRSKSEYPSAGRVAGGEKVDVSTLGKEIGCHDTVATEMTKAPLAECITSDMYKWHKLFMVLQDGCYHATERC